jgi:hypothetical protein
VPQVDGDERDGHVQEREEVPGDRDGVEGERPAGEDELDGGARTSCEQRPQQPLDGKLRLLFKLESPDLELKMCVHTIVQNSLPMRTK